MGGDNEDSFGDIVPAEAFQLPSLIGDTLTASGDAVGPHLTGDAISD